MAAPDPPTPTAAPIPARRTRSSSFTQSLLDANPHYGFCAATGDALASAPSLKDLRRNSLSSINSGGRSRGASQRRVSSTPVSSPGIENGAAGAQFPIHEERDAAADGPPPIADPADEKKQEQQEAQPHWWAVTQSGLHAFWNWFITPMVCPPPPYFSLSIFYLSPRANPDQGFLLTIYMLNIVGWGGMLFLLLCNAAPAMCTPSCSALDSPRRIWIEIDSQILNALFCVTGFGLIPWRFRDLWFLLRWRAGGHSGARARLEEIHGSWFRGPDVDGAPRAPPTRTWKLDFVVWMYVSNTFLQAVLSGFMWGMNRVDRPSWSTGLFVALACTVAGAAGGMVWWEGRKVKRIEGDGGKEEGKEEGAV